MEIRTDLLAHQAAAVEKVAPIRIGALFMEMGTGKSRTAIELARIRQKRISNVVWFCPVSLKETVRREILKHTDSRPKDICVFNGRTNQRDLPRVLWYVVGIESMSASDRVVLTVNRLITGRSMVIVDESSYIKGHNAARTKRITHIAARARYRLILTGTPITQGVVDLYAQMRFLSPKILGYASFYSFACNHLEYHPNYKDLIVQSHNTEFLAAKIRPYVYQVTKEECLDLPAKLYETRYCRMTAEQEAYYEQAKEEILMDLDPDDFTSYTIFRLFTALQQIVSGYWNRTAESGEKEMMELDSSRIDVLMDTVTSIPPEEKIIIWCKFQYDIEGIRKALTERFGDKAVALFHGQLTVKQREAELERFRGPARFFVSTQSCGGHGLTLNESCYTVFYNNGFKFSERVQAEDRNHRIGQERKAVYIDIHCSGTIDDRIANALYSKGNAVEDFKREVDKVKNKKEKIAELIRGL